MGRPDRVVDRPGAASARARNVPRFLAAGDGVLHGDDPDAEAARLPIRAGGLDFHKTETRNALGGVAIPAVSGAVRWRGNRGGAARPGVVQCATFGGGPSMVSA